MLKLKDWIVILDRFADVFSETYFTFQLEDDDRAVGRQALPGRVRVHLLSTVHQRLIWSEY